MREVKKPNGQKEWVRSEQLEPKQADDILFEMFVHGWIDKEHRFRATKYTRPDLAEIIKDNEPITEASGQVLARWAEGSTIVPERPRPPLPPPRLMPLNAPRVGRQLRRERVGQPSR